MSRRWRLAHGPPPERSARFPTAPPRSRCRTGACSWRAAPSPARSRVASRRTIPATSAWASGGDLVVARSGHAAALLKDGRVLYAGGMASDGPSFDVEIYDPATGVSAHAGDMTLARVDHAAAALKDGRVLLVGGFDGRSSLDLAETFDPATGQSAGVAAGDLTAVSRPRRPRCSTGTCWWRAATTVQPGPRVGRNLRRRIRYVLRNGRSAGHGAERSRGSAAAEQQPSADRGGHDERARRSRQPNSTPTGTTASRARRTP